MNIFTLIDYGMKAKQGYDTPDEFIAETSFAFVESFFTTSFIILSIISGALLFFGFKFGYNLMILFGVLFLIILIVDIMIYRFTKKTLQNISTQVTSKVKRKMNNIRTIDVDATDV